VSTTASKITGDLFGGLTAAVIALPLALAFGVASGIGPVAGLYGAIAVGFFAALFGGTPAQVSGPTGPMTVVMATIVALHADNLSTAFTIVMLGGLFQILLGLLRVGRYVSYTPYSVISGFMSGIGAIIILIQILPFFGLAAAAGGTLGAVQALPQIAQGINLHAFIIALSALSVMVFWPASLRRFLPPPLAALIIGTLLATFVFQNAPVIGEVPKGLPTLYFPSVAFGELPALLQPAFILALLGSIDSLLTSLVADSITRTHHNSNRELIGQGIGNIAAGLIGGLPGAGATMRTVVNVRAGGRTPISGAFHAIILLSLLLGLGPLAERIPHAVLAGILMKVGWDIIDWNYLRHIRTAPRAKVAVMLITLLLTVFVDLITAVAVGLILASFVTAQWMESEELKGVTSVAIPEDDDDFSDEERRILEEQAGRILIVSLRGRFSYASARELVKRGGASIKTRVLIYDFTHAAGIDTTAAFAVNELINAGIGDGRFCLIAGLSGSAKQTLNSLGVLRRIASENILPTRADAIAKAETMLGKDSGIV
jgi:sulfate permease, SulP family